MTMKTLHFVTYCWLHIDLLRFDEKTLKRLFCLLFFLSLEEITSAVIINT